MGRVGHGHGQGTFVCTCARAHRTSVSQERLDRLCSNLVSGLWAMNYVLSTSHGWYISARAQVHTALLHLGNGLADCVQIWCMGWGLLTTCFPQVMGGVHLHVRTCAPLFHTSGTAGRIVLKFGG